jgi:hypothetical protein
MAEWQFGALDDVTDVYVIDTYLDYIINRWFVKDLFQFGTRKSSANGHLRPKMTSPIDSATTIS